MGKSAQAHVEESYSTQFHQQKRESVFLQHDRARLTDFIKKNTPQIVAEWEAFALTLSLAANPMTALALRDHIHEILAFIVNDIESTQTPSEQIQKSRGENKKNSASAVAETHAALRLAGGFNIDQMVSEYRALRASVTKLWGLSNTQMDIQDVVDLTRFNEAVDQQLAEAVSYYTEKVSYSKNLLLAILSHDLRNPLGAIATAAYLTANFGELNERQGRLVTQISESASRITTIIDDLLDVTRAQLGAKLPVTRGPMDMGLVSRRIVDEMRIVHSTRVIILEISGDVTGDWDQARLGQVLSNLIGNAIQYSFKDTAIIVAVAGTSKDVILSVHNEGIPIPPEKLGSIFNSLTRAVTNEDGNTDTINLGLGLYIAKDVVVSHGGMIDVRSSEKGGTTFIARFPKS